jgi:hypothetical protein
MGGEGAGMEVIGVLLLILTGSGFATMLLLAWAIKVNSQGRAGTGHRPRRRIPSCGDRERNPIPRDDPQDQYPKGI